MLATLILTLCWHGACREVRPLLQPVPLMACMVQAQRYGATWSAEHPGGVMRGWKCRMGDKPEDRAA